MLHDIVSCVVRSKKNVIHETIYKHWVAIFGGPKKILVDNGGEFTSSDFIIFCENVNIRIWTTIAESPWSNAGVIERHDAVLGLTMTQTIADSNCDLEIAVFWVVSAKNPPASNNGFSPN